MHSFLILLCEIFQDEVWGELESYANDTVKEYPPLTQKSYSLPGSTEAPAVNDLKCKTNGSSSAEQHPEALVSRDDSSDCE